MIAFPLTICWNVDHARASFLSQVVREHNHWHLGWCKPQEEKKSEGHRHCYKQAIPILQEVWRTMRLKGIVLVFAAADFKWGWVATMDGHSLGSSTAGNLEHLGTSFGWEKDRDGSQGNSRVVVEGPPLLSDGSSKIPHCASKTEPHCMQPQIRACEAKPNHWGVREPVVKLTLRSTPHSRTNTNSLPSLHYFEGDHFTWRYNSS